MVVTMSVRLAIESVTFVDKSLLVSVKLRPVWEFQTPICEGQNERVTKLTQAQKSCIQDDE